MSPFGTASRVPAQNMQQRRKGATQTRGGEKNRFFSFLGVFAFLVFLLVFLVEVAHVSDEMRLHSDIAVLEAQWQAKPDDQRKLSPSPLSPYAYTFVMGGVDPMRPSYRGMLWGIVVNVYSLKKYGSEADFILFVQLTAEASAAYEAANHTTTSDSLDPFGLTPTERKVLDALGIQLRILETGQVSNTFHDITMNKFVILTLTEYQKVIFLDADLVLLGNLDYLFEAPFLRNNFYMATAGEAANAGLFMITPQVGN